jgi:hypothetical protein
MASIFNNDIIPRNLTIAQQNELAIKYAKSELVGVLMQQELDYKKKYDQAVFVEAKKEAEDWQVILNIINKALKFSSN